MTVYGFRCRIPRARCAAALLAASLAVVTAAEAVVVTGTVRDEAGGPVSSAMVAFTNEADVTQRFSTASRDDGTYRIDFGDVIPTLAAMETEATPGAYGLFQNYPNPFNPGTVIPFQTPVGARVSLIVYNSLGQQVRSLLDAQRPAGAHEVTWDATDDAGRGVAAGVYFYRLQAAGFARTGKMVLVDGNAATPALATSRVLVPAWHDGRVGKVLALPSLYTVMVSGIGFSDYTRSGVAITSDMVVDILVNRASDKGILRIGLTDAPVDGAEAVRLTVSAVDIKRSDSDDGPWETFTGQRTFDLLALQGVSEMLGEQVLEAGPVTGIRLIIESAQIDIHGGTFDLDVPSGSQSGLKLKGDFELVPGQILDLTMDFDARRSIVQQGRGDNYLLKPVVRLVATAETGAIGGRLLLADTFLPEPPEPGPVVLASESQLTGVGPGEEVELTLVASGLTDVRQIAIIVELEPANAFDLGATDLDIEPSGFVSPGNDVLSPTEVRLGAANLSGAVAIDGELGTITLETSSSFSADSPARIRISQVSVGPSLTQRQVFEADDLNITVGLNGAALGLPPGSIPGFGDLEVAVVAYSSNQEVTSTRVDLDEGEYRLSFLPAGTYDVRVEAKEGLVATPQVVSGVVVAAGQQTKGIDFSLSGTPTE